jgi:hypothetical protein
MPRLTQRPRTHPKTAIRKISYEWKHIFLKKSRLKQTTACLGGSQKRDAEVLEKYGNLPDNFSGGDKPTSHMIRTCSDTMLNLQFCVSKSDYTHLYL